MKKVLTGTLLACVVVIYVHADELSANANTNGTAYSGSPIQPQSYGQSWDKRIGLGFMVGEPTGLSGKLWINDMLAIDATTGVSFYEKTGFSTHADVLWNLYDCPAGAGHTSFYIGVGPRIKVEDRNNDDDVWFGFRFPIGVSYMFDDKPMEVFFEVGPIVDVTPDTRGSFTAALGVRYWF